MNTIFINETKTTPAIYFNTNKGILNISGKSLSEDPTTFYNVLSDALDEMVVSNPNISFNITIELEYINTMSSSLLYKFLRKSNLLFDKVLINWGYEEDDEDIYELGKVFEKELDMKFNFKALAIDARFV